jgi:hypothetical protein
MTNAPTIYVLTLDSSSRKGIRLWTGKSIHALRHCSAKQVGHALMDLQQHVDRLQYAVRAPVPSGSYSLNRSR